MKKTVSLLLAFVLLFSVLVVPVSYVGAASADYADRYVFSFAQENVYSYTALKKGEEAAGTLTFVPASGVGTASLAPLYGSTNYVNNWGGIKAEYKSVEVGGAIYDAVNVVSANDAVFVPITNDGKPFELAPGHTYTVYVAYTHTGNATNDNWYATRGLYVGGGMYKADLNSNKHARKFASVAAFGSEAVPSMPFGAKVDDLLNIDSTGIIERTVTFTTPAAMGSSYTYDADKNAYTATVTYTSTSGGGVVGETAELDFYNYLYFYFDHYGTGEINITALEITRDDFSAEAVVEFIDEDGTVLKTEETNVGKFNVNYTPAGSADKQFLGWYLDEAYTTPAGSVVDVTEAGLKLYARWGERINWAERLDDYYKFDFSNVGYYADWRDATSVFEDPSIYTCSPIVIDPGYDREERNVYPVYSGSTGIKNWKEQTWSNPSTVEYDGETYSAMQVTSINPSFFVPLKDDGTPFELAPGHKYTVNYKYYVRAYESGAPMLQCDIGVTSNGKFVQNSQTALTDTAMTSTRFGWLSGNTGTIQEGSLTITVPADTTEGYNPLENTYTKNVGGVDYTLYNYLNFSLTNYGKPVIDFISLEVIRDDYVVMGTVEYVDEDGSVMKSEEVSQGEYAINYIPANTAEKYFAGWYLDEACTSRVTSAKLSVSANGLKLYAKWEAYKDSIVSVNPSYYYGVTFVPNLTAAGVYSHQTSARSSVNSTTIATTADKLTLSTSFWGDGILLTAVDDESGELFRAKPNTAYKVTLKFRITAETTRADDIDVTVAAGAGLPDTNANYPMGKYWDENNLKSKLASTKYTDGVTEEGKFVTYSAIYTTGEFTTIPAIGVELWLYQDAAVEIYSLSVSEFDGEDLSAGEFLVSKEVANNTTYMVNFDYSLSDTPTNDIGIGFKTTAADTIGYPTFIEGEDVAIYTVKADKALNEWFTATVLLTTDMTANVVNSYGYDDVVTALNTNLYGYIIGDEVDKLSVKNVAIKALTDTAGNDLVNAVGGQCLTSEAEAAAGSQAIRYSFTYDTKTGNEIIIDGKEYKVLERGFIYTNGNSYAKGGLYKADFNYTNAKAGKFNFNVKKTALDICWKYSAIGGTDLYSLVFSTYVKDFDIDDTKELMVKAFVVIEIDGQQFTVYSDSVNRSVAYLKSLA